MTNKHIILLGFKHVGKSILGGTLANKLQYRFFDVDKEVEKKFSQQHQQLLSVREIIQQHGQAFFSILENKLLTELLQNEDTTVIALGGGTPLEEENQTLIANEILIHITAPQEHVFQRIIAQGRPTFFSPEQSMREAFNELWEKRLPIYNSLAQYTINNHESVEKVTDKIIKLLQPKKLLLLHGPNLNKLGQRDVAHYGKLTLADIEALTQAKAKEYNIEVLCYQSNHEGDLIDILQAESDHCLGIIINPGAFAHYSYALHDAILDTKLPAVEVHLSKIAERETWRQHSVTASACIQVISGKKHQGYLEAVTLLMENQS